MRPLLPSPVSQWVAERISSLIHLAYPVLCPACKIKTPIKGGIICLDCEFSLPWCRFQDLKNTEFHQRLTGRIPVNWGVSLLYLRDKKVKNLIHELKYAGAQEIGHSLGSRLGEICLCNSANIQKPDWIIPVPLHPKKLFVRGFNQSESIGIGITTKTRWLMNNCNLRRVLDTESQTKKNKIDRINNVRAAFDVLNPKEIAGKNILLVDDVFTSGATFESCAIKLMDAGAKSISLATLAIADDW